jgi:integral membrane sensor domain MASE1
VLGPKRRALITLTLALVVLGASADLVLLTARGAGAPGWAHWWCSASALRQHGGQSSSGLTASLLGSLRAIAPHWPHILPIVAASATLVYLRRANARYHANEARAELHV